MAETTAAISEKWKKISRTDEAGLIHFADQFGSDDRVAVRKLVQSAERALRQLGAEKKRLEEMRCFERKCEEDGYTLICGIDEAGRGPLAGPVVAGAVILPNDCMIFGLNDSKKLTPGKREELYGEIMEKAVAAGYGIVGPQRIDEINILQADYEAMCEAIGTLRVMPQVLLNDAVTIPQVLIPQVPIVHGDARSLSIAAASVIAKVTRDRLMVEYDAVYQIWSLPDPQKNISEKQRRKLGRIVMTGEQSAAENGGRVLKWRTRETAA